MANHKSEHGYSVTCPCCFNEYDDYTRAEAARRQRELDARMSAPKAAPADIGRFTKEQLLERNRELVRTLDKLSAQLTTAKAEREAGLRALVHAEARFGLLAGYGLPGDSNDINYECMKEIAEEARRDARAAIAKVEGKP